MARCDARCGFQCAYVNLTWGFGTIIYTVRACSDLQAYNIIYNNCTYILCDVRVGSSKAFKTAYYEMDNYLYRVR